MGSECMIGNYLLYVPTYARSTKGIIGGKEICTYVSTYIGLRSDGVSSTSVAPTVVRRYVFQGGIGTRWTQRVLGAEPKLPA